MEAIEFAQKPLLSSDKATSYHAVVPQSKTHDVSRQTIYAGSERNLFFFVVLLIAIVLAGTLMVMPTVDRAYDVAKEANERTSKMQKTLLSLQTTVNSIDSHRIAQNHHQETEMKLLNTLACNSCDEKALCAVDSGTVKCDCWQGFTGDGRNCEICPANTKYNNIYKSCDTCMPGYAKEESGIVLKISIGTSPTCHSHLDNVTLSFYSVQDNYPVYRSQSIPYVYVYYTNKYGTWEIGPDQNPDSLINSTQIITEEGDGGAYAYDYHRRCRGLRTGSCIDTLPIGLDRLEGEWKHWCNGSWTISTINIQRDPQECKLAVE